MALLRAQLLAEPILICVFGLYKATAYTNLSAGHRLQMISRLNICRQIANAQAQI